MNRTIIRQKATWLIGMAMMLMPYAFTHKRQVAAAEINPKPNIIIILTDDQGYGDVGFNGCKDITTPNIDGIAKNGVVFRNAYVSYAVCAPSRAGQD